MFLSMMDDQKAFICILRLSEDKVVVVAKAAALTVRLWHSHKSKLTVFTKHWDRWVDLDQGPGLDRIDLPINGKNRTDSADCLRHLFM